MTDWIVTAIGAFTVGFFLGGCRYAWAHRRLVVWDYDAQAWRSARDVVLDRDHGYPRRHP